MSDSTTPTIVELPLEDVYPHPKHYRDAVRAEDVDKLAASIAVVGQLEPITVFRDGEIYIIDAGHHRVAALKKLGADTVSAIVAEGSDEARSVSVMVASNMHVPENEIERSRGTQLLLSTGVRPIEAAALIGESQDKVSKVARALPIAKDYAEDMSLDRLAVLDEFAGDDDSIAQLLKAPEANWKQVYDGLVKARKREADIEAARAVIESAGCTVIEDIDRSKLEWLGQDEAAPEGAQYGKVNLSYVNVWISWWKDAGEKEVDPEETARLEQEAFIEAALQAAEDLRVDFICNHLSNNGPAVPGNELRDFAIDCWENREIEARKSKLVDGLKEISGTFPRIYASLLSTVEVQTRAVIKYPGNGTTTHYVDRYGQLMLDYFEALDAVGYAITDAENGIIAEVEEYLAGDAS